VHEERVPSAFPTCVAHRWFHFKPKDAQIKMDEGVPREQTHSNAASLPAAMAATSAASMLTKRVACSKQSTWSCFSTASMLPTGMGAQSRMKTRMPARKTT